MTKYYSVLTEHKIYQGHDFDWKNVKIFDKDTNYRHRSVPEMIFIKKAENTINKQEDTKFLSFVYD